MNFSLSFLYLKQAYQKVLKVGGGISLEPAKRGGPKRRAMYLNLEILVRAPPAPSSGVPVKGQIVAMYLVFDSW